MLFKYAHICIKTNDCVAKYFIISRSCREGFSIAPFLYTAGRTCGLYYKEGGGGVVIYKGLNYTREKIGNI